MVGRAADGLPDSAHSTERGERQNTKQLSHSIRRGPCVMLSWAIFLLMGMTFYLN